jgi:hypothetical protein
MCEITQSEGDVGLFNDTNSLYNPTLYETGLVKVLSGEKGCHQGEKD